eukprot:TRINITY_DN28200_c0_g1_i2.p2 TRINITY_DN28200_c0_g1~~TRINITY_DN28200_c0_g1_i2.p2  ORF type:complete len:115 (-),score=6.77 TRINITY_DN28200_c0_g1_i2:61-405(-)
MVVGFLAGYFVDIVLLYALAADAGSVFGFLMLYSMARSSWLCLACWRHLHLHLLWRIGHRHFDIVVVSTWQPVERFCSLSVRHANGLSWPRPRERSFHCILLYGRRGDEQAVVA